jgi:hypothetical protein
MLPFVVKAQLQTEYNQKGNEAKERKDYREAIFWYEQGVPDCNKYSISQLTDIWKTDENIRASMRVIMGNCLLCLTEYAQGNDTIAIKQLIDYYSDGIGTVINEGNANFWKGQLEQIRRPATDIYPQRDPKDRMKFFAGYHVSLIAPYGIQVGGMGKSVGWYVRLRSNFNFHATPPYDCQVVSVKDQNQKIQYQLEIDQFDKNTYYRATGKYKETVLMGSAGIMVKAAPNILVSAGAGYWDRKYSREFIQVNNDGTDQQTSLDWAKDKNRSMNGITIDLDGTYVISDRFYGTLGASLMGFKYVYPGIGIGVFF